MMTAKPSKTAQYGVVKPPQSLNMPTILRALTLFLNWQSSSIV